MTLTRRRSIANVAAAVLVAGVAVGGLSACGGPPAQPFQQQSRGSGQIPPGAVVTGGSVSQGQTSGWYGGTGGSVDFGK